MILYFKVGSMPGEHYRVVRKRKPPVIGECFKIAKPGERFARHEPVRLLEIRNLTGLRPREYVGQLLYVVERF